MGTEPNRPGAIPDVCRTVRDTGLGKRPGLPRPGAYLAESRRPLGLAGRRARPLRRPHFVRKPSLVSTRCRPRPSFVIRSRNRFPGAHNGQVSGGESRLRFGSTLSRSFTCQRKMSSRHLRVPQRNQCFNVHRALGHSPPTQLGGDEPPLQRAERFANSAAHSWRCRRQARRIRRAGKMPEAAAQRRPPCFSAKVAICSRLTEPVFSASMASKLR